MNSIQLDKIFITKETIWKASPTLNKPLELSFMLRYYDFFPLLLFKFYFVFCTSIKRSKNYKNNKKKRISPVHLTEMGWLDDSQFIFNYSPFKRFVLIHLSIWTHTWAKFWLLYIMIGKCFAEILWLTSSSVNTFHSGLYCLCEWQRTSENENENRKWNMFWNQPN